MMLPLLCAACAPPPPRTHVPDELLSPCPLDDSKPIVTAGDAVAVYADAVTALACANGRIVAIADILHGVDK